MIDILDDVVVDEELSDGARNAVNTCLRLKPFEKVTLITDDASRDIAASIHREIMKVGSPCTTFALERFAPRPHTEMPQEILDDLATSQVSVYAVVGQFGELKTRMEMTAVITKHRIRHAHMINITKEIMTDGMRADFNEIDKISSTVRDIAAAAKKIRATSSGGTDIIAEFSPQIKWIKTSGIINTEKWGNLPGGEVFTSPKNVNGMYVVDGVVGDYLCAKYADLKDSPLTIYIKDSRISEIHSSNKKLEEEFWSYTHTDKNSDRVGEFAIGTNTKLTRVIGNILQDEKIPGVHIAFGHPYAEHTGAQWRSSTHIDVVGTGFTIVVDDRRIMERGRFTL